MSEPLSEIVLQLKPTIVQSKLVEGSGNWCVRRRDTGQPFYCAVLQGRCELIVSDRPAATLNAGDFVLIPAAFTFAVASALGIDASPFGSRPETRGEARVRVGDTAGKVDVRLIVGHCKFASPDSALLSSLLPALVHISANPRLSALVRLVADEARARRPARAAILTRLLEVILVEALRTASTEAHPPRLARGLADHRIAVAIRRMHERPEYPWTMAQLAKTANLSRSSFFSRFSRTVGITPMEYLVSWRMTLAKSLLRDPALKTAQVAERVGYGAASSFSVAFSRHVGMPPVRFARKAKRLHESA